MTRFIVCFCLVFLTLTSVLKWARFCGGKFRAQNDGDWNVKIGNFEGAFRSTAALHNSGRCSKYNGTTPLGEELQAPCLRHTGAGLHLNKIPRSKWMERQGGSGDYLFTFCLYRLQCNYGKSSVQNDQAEANKEFKQ
jgi:hypothetical protein